MRDPFYVVRAGRPSDHAFISESWQAANSQTAIGREHGEHYISEQKGLIRAILARPDTAVRVACVPEECDAILGYSVVGKLESEEPRIYYTYVKTEARRLGIATALLADVLDRVCVYTHKPKATLAEVLPHPEGWHFSYFKNWDGET